MDLGVNLSGAEFGAGGTRGVNYDYTYPSHAEIDYYASKGLDVIRLPVLWERVQPTENGALDAAQLSYIDNVVNYAATKGIKVDLDIHNYGYGYGNQVGSSGTPDSAFADLWGKLASHFSSSPNIMFGLMNEPNDISATQWLGAANAAISAIRAAGAHQEILVPGTYWDGGQSWTTTDNATVLGNGIVDSGHNFAFEVHQYLDSDNSGTHANVVSATIGVERLTAITQWAEQTGNKLFLGEFGAGTDQTSLAALDNMLHYMSDHSDVWQGGTEWGGGPWWGNYMYSVEPTGLGTSSQTDKPQIAILQQYLHALSSTTTASVAASAAAVVASAGSHVSSSPVPVPDNSGHFGGYVHSAASAGGQVFAFYEAFLGRAPDSLGFENLTHDLQSGMSLHDLAQVMLSSGEHQQNFGAFDRMSDAAFVEQLYEVIQHRAADAPGLAHWQAALAGGESRVDVGISFALSTEHLNSLQGAFTAGIYDPDKGAADVARLYYGIQGRAPDAGGLAHFVQAMSNGQSLQNVAKDFLASAEYQSKFGGLDDAHFVDALYQNALGRHAEADGLNHFVDALQHGSSRAAVALDIAESNEAHVHHMGVIESGWVLA